jgi:hypothetical protein
MRKWIALGTCLLVLFTFVVAVWASEYVTITNSDFDTDLSGWTQTGTCAYWFWLECGYDLGCIQVVPSEGYDCGASQTVSISEPDVYTLTVHALAIYPPITITLGTNNKICDIPMEAWASCSITGNLPAGNVTIGFSNYDDGEATLFDDITLYHDADSTATPTATSTSTSTPTPTSTSTPTPTGSATPTNTPMPTGTSQIIVPVTPAYSVYTETLSTGDVYAIEARYTYGEIAIERVLWVIAILFGLRFVYDILYLFWWRRFDNDD